MFETFIDVLFRFFHHLTNKYIADIGEDNLNVIRYLKCLNILRYPNRIS